MIPCVIKRPVGLVLEKGMLVKKFWIYYDTLFFTFLAGVDRILE